MLLVLPSMSDQEIKYIQKLINLINSCLLDSKNEYQISEVSSFFQFLFQTLRIPWKPTNSIRLNQNIYALFEQIHDFPMEEYFNLFPYDNLINFINPEDALNILNNLIDCGYTQGIAKLLNCIFNMLFKLKKYDILKIIHEQFVMKRIILKLKCKNCLSLSLQILRQTLNCFQKECALTDDQIIQLQTQFIFIQKFNLKIFRKDELKDLTEFFIFLEKSSYLCKNLSRDVLTILRDIIKECKNKSFYYSDYNIEKIIKSQIDLSSDLNRNDKYQKSNQYDIKLSGLKNPRNNCYINSFIHSLYYSADFRQFILNLKPKISREKIFTDFTDPIEELMKVFMKMEATEQSQDIESYQLKQSFPEPFRSSIEQQDSGEFGREFLNFLDEYFKKTQSCDEINKLFFGEVETIITCLSCKKSCSNTDKMLDIYISFCESALNKNTHEYNLSAMIRDSFKEELLEKNTYACDFCKDSSSIKKQTKPKIIPPYLILTVRCFQYDKVRKEQVKILNTIELPQKIHLADIFSEIPERMKYDSGLEYELFAFIVHLGSTMDGGHYNAYCRNLDGTYSRWIYYDDSYVSESSQSSADKIRQNFAKEETPYILFYQNKGRKQIQLDKIIDSSSASSQQKQYFNGISNYGQKSSLTGSTGQNYFYK